MSKSAVELARAAMSAYEELDSFEVTQKINAGKISAEAHIRYRKPGKMTVEYRAYQDPLSEFEEKLAGGVEFIGNELIGMQLIYDGHGTWIYDAGNNVALYKPGKKLYSPLRGSSSLGEVGFLRGLTSDFLLRYEEAEAIAGRDAHRVGLKPKVSHRSLLLKEESFPIKRATLVLDAETSFPLKISCYPTQRSPMAYLVAPGTPVVIEYVNPQLNKVDDQRFSFTPPKGTRVFREQVVGKDKLGELLPFDLPLEALEGDEKYDLYSDRAVLTVNEEKDRGYVLLTLVPRQENEEKEHAPAMLSLCVGNYLSRNMNRRRAFLSEQGEKLMLGKVTAQFLDRGALVEDQLPTGMKRKIMELGWKKGETYWFLLAEELDKESLVKYAQELAKTEE